MVPWSVHAAHKKKQIIIRHTQTHTDTHALHFCSLSLRRRDNFPKTITVTLARKDTKREDMESARHGKFIAESLSIWWQRANVHMEKQATVFTIHYQRTKSKLAHWMHAMQCYADLLMRPRKTSKSLPHTLHFHYFSAHKGECPKDNHCHAGKEKHKKQDMKNALKARYEEHTCHSIHFQGAPNDRQDYYRSDL